MRNINTSTVLVRPRQRQKPLRGIVESIIPSNITGNNILARTILLKKNSTSKNTATAQRERSHQHHHSDQKSTATTTLCYPETALNNAALKSASPTNTAYERTTRIPHLQNPTVQVKHPPSVHELLQPKHPLYVPSMSPIRRTTRAPRCSSRGPIRLRRDFAQGHAVGGSFAECFRGFAQPPRGSWVCV